MVVSCVELGGNMGVQGFFFWLNIWVYKVRLNSVKKRKRLDRIISVLSIINIFKTKVLVIQIYGMLIFY